MLLTVHVPPDLEKKVRENILLGDIDAVRNTLIEALEPTLEAFMNTTTDLSAEELERKLDQIADLFMKYVGPDVPPLSDYALSREGIYQESRQTPTFR